MKRTLLALLLATAVLPASAQAKGPAAASIDGPGAGGGITFEGDEGSGPLGALTQQAGFFPAAFGQEPNPMLQSRPKGDLGPRYTITYRVPGPHNEADQIRQDVYPYAQPAPVTYMRPGQPFFGTETTRGGWFQADPALKRTLVAAGVPTNPPASPSTSGSSSDFPTIYVSLLTVLLLAALGTAAAFLIRRRARPAAA
jgi:hypothetical protein